MSIIKIAELNDLDAIMKFIDVEWKKDHILARDRDFFIHKHVDGEKINFIISKDEQGNITATLGFIKASNRVDADLWTVIWKVAKRVDNPMLGVELLQFLRDSGARSLISAGINTATIGIYDFLGIQTGILDHYVLINPIMKDFRIGSFSNPIETFSIISKQDNNPYELKKLNKFEVMSQFPFEDYISSIPFKDEHYFIKRYFEHIHHKYDVYGICQGQKILALFATRVVTHESAAVLRIVEFLGDESLFKYVSEDLKKLVIAQNYEYVDFLCYGYNQSALEEAGFLKIDLDSDKMIVPNYFSPYMKENIKIHFFADVKEDQPFKICKADGDQDRPNGDQDRPN